MYDDELKILVKFYEKIQGYLLDKYKKSPKDSIFLFFFDKTSNDRMEILMRNSIDIDELNEHDVSILIEKNFLQKIDSNKICITGHGLWEYENRINKLNIENLVSKINNKMFIVEKIKLNEKDKILFFTMIATRAFSEKSSFYANASDNIKDEIMKSMIESAAFLHEMGVIKYMIEKDIFGEVRNIHPLAHYLRNNPKRLKKTDLIFTIKKGTNKYYLDVSENSELNLKKLKKMFNLIFEKKLSTLEKEKIYNFCNKISIKYDTSIFGPDHIFSRSYYDKKILDALNM